MSTSSELLSKQSQGLDSTTENQWQQLLADIESIAHSHPDLVFANSLSAEDMLIQYAIYILNIDIECFVINTGMLHKETLNLIDIIKNKFDISLKQITPDNKEINKYINAHGLYGFYQSTQLRQKCCHIRKVAPLKRYLAHRSAWITGQRQEQAQSRAQIPAQEFDTQFQLQKFNPLRAWSHEALWQVIHQHNIPYNPLHDQGYPSIGCAPCTRAIEPGESLRAGRWWWEKDSHQECGLHLSPTQAASTPDPSQQIETNTLTIKHNTRNNIHDNVRDHIRDLNAHGQKETQPANTRAPISLAVNDAHLDWLEAEAIYVLREIAAETQRPALLFSGGKDSAVLLKLAEKAFYPGKLPFPLLHIDTGHNYPEVLAFRDKRVAETQAELIVGHVDDSIRRGTVVLPHAQASRNAAQATTLLETIEQHRIDACLGGARRDEEKARAKERFVSFRDQFGQWDPKNQRAELWQLFNTQIHPGEHLRAFPLSNWTELDIWQYIAREKIELPSLYYAHQRKVVRRQVFLVPVNPLTPAQKGETIEKLWVRFRTVGDISCTCPVASRADSPAAIIQETLSSRYTERVATRMDDQGSESSMEQRKRQGYF